jgi:hypothetical protein
LFDRLVPDFLALPPGVPGRGQVVVAAGDALIRFDASQVSFSKPGLTAIGCSATPDEATRHGVFCLGPDDVASLYLQKPSISVQQARGAIDASGRVALDVAVMSLDAQAAQALLDAFGPMETALAGGIDLYREVCCALGSAATLEHYLDSVRASGSSWTDAALSRVFPALNRIPLYVQLVPACRFLHFGSTRQLIESGLALVAEDHAAETASTVLAVNSRIAPPARVHGRDSWWKPAASRPMCGCPARTFWWAWMWMPLSRCRPAPASRCCPDAIAPERTCGSCAATASATRSSRMPSSVAVPCWTGSAPQAWMRMRCGRT